MKGSILKYLFACIMACFISFGGYAQSSSTGDKYYNEGISYMKKRLYKKAISAFVTAKTAYTSSQKKSLCDVKISECKKKITTHPRPTRTSSDGNGGSTSTTNAPDPQPSPVVVEPTMSFDPIGLDFKANAKEKQEVKVTSSVGQWHVDSKPYWVNVIESSGGIMVGVEKNKTKESRTGKIVFISGGKKFDISVSQQKKGSIFDVVKQTLSKK